MTELSPTLLYGLVLLAAMAHALWNIAVKGAGDPALMLAMIRAVAFPLGIAMAVTAGLPDLETALWIAVAALAHYAYYILLIRSYALGDMGQVYPIARGTPPIILAAVGVLFAGEILTPMQAAGVGVCCLGILLVSGGAGASLRATGMALATAASIAAYSYCGTMGTRSAGSPIMFLGYLEILSSGGVIAWALVARRDTLLCFVRRHAAVGLGAGVLSTAGYLAFLTAVTVLPMAPVAAVRESSVLFGAILSASVLREGFAARRLLAAAFVLTGISLIALAGG